MLPEGRISVCVPVKNNVTLKDTVTLVDDFFCAVSFLMPPPPGFLFESRIKPCGWGNLVLIFRGVPVLFQNLVLMEQESNRNVRVDACSDFLHPGCDQPSHFWLEEAARSRIRKEKKEEEEVFRTISFVKSSLICILDRRQHLIIKMMR